MIVIFAGATVSAYQLNKWGYGIQATQKRLLTGKMHVQLSPYAQNFPRTFQCYTEDYSEITSLAGKIATFR